MSKYPNARWAQYKCAQILKCYRELSPPRTTTNCSSSIVKRPRISHVPQNSYVGLPWTSASPVCDDPFPIMLSHTYIYAFFYYARPIARQQGIPIELARIMDTANCAAVPWWICSTASQLLLSAQVVNGLDYKREWTFRWVCVACEFIEMAFRGNLYTRGSVFLYRCVVWHPRLVHGAQSARIYVRIATWNLSASTDRRLVKFRPQTWFFVRVYIVHAFLFDYMASYKLYVKCDWCVFLGFQFPILFATFLAIVIKVFQCRNNYTNTFSSSSNNCLFTITDDGRTTEAEVHNSSHLETTARARTQTQARADYLECISKEPSSPGTIYCIAEFLSCHHKIRPRNEFVLLCIPQWCGAADAVFACRCNLLSARMYIGSYIIASRYTATDDSTRKRTYWLPRERA